MTYRDQVTPGDQGDGRSLPSAYEHGSHPGDAMLTDDQAERRAYAHLLNMMIAERRFGGKTYDFMKPKREPK